MRLLMLGPEEISALESLVEYAKANVQSTDDLLDRMNNPVLSPGLDPKFQRAIPDGYKVVLTHEQIPAGTIRHLSISVNAKGALPNPAAVESIMNLTGFKGRLTDCQVRIEKLEPGYEAIEVAEFI
jgi:hypothetical protein